MANEKLTVIGYELKEGTFKNDAGKEISYNNVYLHCTYQNKNTVGLGTRTYKLAKDCEFINFNSLDDLINNGVVLSTQSSQYGTTVTNIFCRE